MAKSNKFVKVAITRDNVAYVESQCREGESITTATNRLIEELRGVQSPVCTVTPHSIK